MSTINNNVIINNQTLLLENQNVKKNTNLRITKIAHIALMVLIGALAMSSTIALVATFLPYASLTLAAFSALKVISVITGIALGTFALVKVLDSIKNKLPRPLAKAANCIHAIITEIFALATMSALYFVNLEKSNPKTVLPNPQQPILLIHGLYHNSSAWIEYKKRLKTAHVGPVFTINLGKPFGSINGHAEKVKAKVAEIQRITGRNDIMLIGHSMGGIVASKFALDFATRETKVTDIITIGSPLKGTKVTRYIGFGKSIDEMRDDSNYIRDLSSRISQQTSIRFFHIASITDELVSSSSALFPENVKAKNHLISNLGHAGLLYSKKVIDPIIDYYKNRPVNV